MTYTQPTTRAERQAVSQAAAARRAHTHIAIELPDGIAHGTAGYRRGCKCEPCRKSQRDRHQRARDQLRRATPDEQARPWRYWCLIADNPADDQAAECGLPLGHAGDHDWYGPKRTANRILARHGMAAA